MNLGLATENLGIRQDSQESISISAITANDALFHDFPTISILEIYRSGFNWTIPHRTVNQPPLLQRESATHVESPGFRLTKNRAIHN